jgi:hypothetical protein
VELQAMPLTSLKNLSVVTLSLLAFSLCLSPSSSIGSDSIQNLEMVRGSGCYRFGDDETPAKARRAAMTLAQEEAVRRHRVFVEASSRVKNFQLDEDVVRTASAAFLQDIVIEKEERQNQEICVTLTAKLSPVSAEQMLQQKLAAKEISQRVEAALIPSKQAFGLKIWTNKDQNKFIEDDRLIIYVKSDRDAYLKLDYFQADGKVVHLVPNIYRGQAQIVGGTTYAFGDDSGPDQFVVKEPYGDEIIKAVVSSKPFDIPKDAETVSESRQYLQGGLRGIKLVAAESSLPLKTVSKTVDEYNKFWTGTEKMTGQASSVTPQSK